MNADQTLLATALGYVGVLANLVWPLMRHRPALLGGQVVACILMGVHFELLAAHTGACIMLVAGIQAALAVPLGLFPRFKFIYLGSLMLTPVVCFLSWQGPPSVFSSLALAIVCIANFQLKVLYQRAWLITAIFAWGAHNLMVGSMPGLLSNTLAFCVSALMLFRLYRSPRLLSM